MERHVALRHQPHDILDPGLVIAGGDMAGGLDSLDAVGDGWPEIGGAAIPLIDGGYGLVEAGTNGGKTVTRQVGQILLKALRVLN